MREVGPRWPAPGSRADCRPCPRRGHVVRYLHRLLHRDFLQSLSSPQHSAAHLFDYPPLVRVASILLSRSRMTLRLILSTIILASRSTAARHASRLFQLASELSRAAFGSSFMA